MHFVEELLAHGVERNAPAGARRFGDDCRPVLAYFRDAIAQVKEIGNAFPLPGRAEIAAARLAGAFEQVADRQSLREPLPVVPLPAELERERPEEQRRIGHAAGKDDVGAASERLRDRLRAQIRIGKQQPLLHGGDIGARIEVRERLARRPQFIDAGSDRVAGHDGDPGLPSFGMERFCDRFAGAFRIEAAGIEHELDAVFRGERPEFGEHRHRIARVAGGRILLAVFLQDRERELGQMVRADVLHAAALDRGAHRAPRIAVEAQPCADTNRLHAAFIPAAV